MGDSDTNISMCVLGRVWLFVAPWTIYSPPGSSVHGIFKARILEWVAICRGSSQPRDRMCVSCIGRQMFYDCSTWGAPTFQHERDNVSLSILSVCAFEYAMLVTPVMPHGVLSVFICVLFWLWQKMGPFSCLSKIQPFHHHQHDFKHKRETGDSI